MTFFEQSVFFGVSVSLAAYGIGVLLQKKFKFALFNPRLISVVLTIAVLLTAHISYDTFYEGAQDLSLLLLENEQPVSETWSYTFQPEHEMR